MSGFEQYEEEQAMEVEALEAILMDELEVVSATSPREYHVKLVPHPSDDGENHGKHGGVVGYIEQTRYHRGVGVGPASITLCHAVPTACAEDDEAINNVFSARGFRVGKLSAVLGQSLHIPSHPPSSQWECVCRSRYPRPTPKWFLRSA
jgi:hypothetical protein